MDCRGGSSSSRHGSRSSGIKGREGLHLFSLSFARSHYAATLVLPGTPRLLIAARRCRDPFGARAANSYRAGGDRRERAGTCISAFLGEDVWVGAGNLVAARELPGRLAGDEAHYGTGIRAVPRDFSR